MTWEFAETITKVLAIVAAGGFFVWKLATGWLLINLSVSVTTDRRRISEHSDEDWLAVTAMLEKGPTDTLRLTDIQVRIRQITGAGLEPEREAREEKFSGLESLDLDRGKIAWSSGRNRGATLSPGEKTHFAHAFRVKHGSPYLVEVAVAGRRLLVVTYFRWRASTVSLPGGAKSESAPNPRLQADGSAAV